MLSQLAAGVKADSGAGRGVTLYTWLVAFSQWSKRCPANLILLMVNHLLWSLSMRDFVVEPSLNK